MESGGFQLDNDKTWLRPGFVIGGNCFSSSSYAIDNCINKHKLSISHRGWVIQSIWDKIWTKNGHLVSRRTAKKLFL